MAPEVMDPPAPRTADLKSPIKTPLKTAPKSPLKTAPRSPLKTAPLTPWRAQQHRELQALIDSLPDQISCICELCDCGRCVHTHTCKNQPKPKTSSGEPFPSTHTHDMFQPKYAPPRSSKKPPPTPRATDVPPMEFSTNQRDDFIPRPIAMRVPVDPPKANYERPTDPLDNVTYYRQEFPPKKLSTPSRVVQIKHDDNMGKMVANPKFYGDTTNKEHFKQWRPVSNRKADEAPSFAAELLYPIKEVTPKSTIQQAFPGKGLTSVLIM